MLLNKFTCVGLLIFTVIVTVLKPNALTQPDNYSPLKGERNDDHGNISWESSAEYLGPDAGNLWEYKRIVKNRSTSSNCYIRWEVIEFSSMVPPGQEQPAGSFKVEIPPEMTDGFLYYNGGVTAGESKARADIWRQQDRKDPEPSLTLGFQSGGSMFGAALSNALIWRHQERSNDKVRNSESNLTLGFELNGKFYQVAMTAKSVVSNTDSGGHYSVDYKIKADGVNKLPQGIAIKWELTKTLPPPRLAEDGTRIDTFLRFDEGEEWKANLKFVGSLSFRSDLVSIIDTRTKAVLAKGRLSVFGIRDTNVVSS